jgi:hypothetical protein
LDCIGKLITYSYFAFDDLLLDFNRRGFVLEAVADRIDGTLDEWRLFTGIPLQVTALDCIGKLITYSYFAFPSAETENNATREILSFRTAANSDLMICCWISTAVASFSKQSQIASMHWKADHILLFRIPICRDREQCHP